MWTPSEAAGVADGSLLWTERSSRSLHRGQESGKHRPGLLRRDKSLRWMGMDVSPVCPLHPQGYSLLV
jgi:hypothetical protein